MEQLTSANRGDVQLSARAESRTHPEKKRGGQGSDFCHWPIYAAGNSLWWGLWIPTKADLFIDFLKGQVTPFDTGRSIHHDCFLLHPSHWSLRAAQTISGGLHAEEDSVVYLNTYRPRTAAATHPWDAREENIQMSRRDAGCPREEEDKCATTERGGRIKVKSLIKCQQKQHSLFKDDSQMCSFWWTETLQLYYAYVNKQHWRPSTLFVWLIEDVECETSCSRIRLVIFYCFLVYHLMKIPKPMTTWSHSVSKHIPPIHYCLNNVCSALLLWDIS